MSTPEGRIKRRINRILDDARVYYRMPVPSGFGRKVVDYYGCRPGDGRFFVIEAKAPGEKPTPLQRSELRRVYEGGGAAFMLDGDDEDMLRFKTWLITPSFGAGSVAEQMVLKHITLLKDMEIIA
jgi:hypothetical protein